MFKFAITMLIAVSALAFPITSYAAQFHANEKLSFPPDQTLNNAYLAGSTISVKAPVQNDLAVAGSEITLDSAIEGSLLAAGSEIRVNGNVGRNARIAGADIAINSQISQDIVVFGGNVTLNSSAAVLGDVVFAGGKLTINGPVSGKVVANCDCDVTIDSRVGSVDASRVKTLTFGSKAVVERGVTYTSEQQAITHSGATINGAINHNPVMHQSITQRFNSFMFFYGLVANFLFALLILFLLRKIVDTAIHSLKLNAIGTFGLGIATMVFLPLLSLAFIPLSIWVTLTGLALYVLLLLTAYGLGQIIIGWWLMQWWLGRNREVYQLDWRAVLIGVAATTTLYLVPGLGWFIIFIGALLALGGLTYGLWQLHKPLAE